MNPTTLEDTTLPGRFLRGLARSPDRPAVRVGSAAPTYRELHAQASLLAGSLLAGTAERRPAAVGVLVGKGVSAYPTLLAGLYTGITTVPLQPGFPAERTARMIESAGVGALLADDDALPALTALHAAGVDLPVLYAPGGQPMPAIGLDPAAALTGPVRSAPSDTAYVLFTSGSTGRPKGVPVTHAHTHHYFELLDKRYDFGPEDVFSQNFDLNFDCGMFDLFCAWGAGAVLVPPPPQAFRSMPEFAAEQGLTVWFSTPSAIALIRRLGGLEPGALPSLRWSFFAGEALGCQDADDWAAAAPGSVVENLYGPTELTITVSVQRWTGDRTANGTVPIGTVHEGHDTLLLDPEGQELPDPDRTGAEGELCVAGAQLTAGYLDPADDEGRFLDLRGQRWYRTGDRVRRLADGGLLYLGRQDSQVQVHGVRVELAEVEDAVRRCTGVEEAVAVAVPVDGTVELAVFHTGAAVPLRELAAAAGRRLPAAVVPRRYIHLEQLPLNSNRKTDRKQLALLAASPAPGAQAPAVPHTPDAAQGSNERSCGAQ